MGQWKTSLDQATNGDARLPPPPRGQQTAASSRGKGKEDGTLKVQDVRRPRAGQAGLVHGWTVLQTSPARGRRNFKGAARNPPYPRTSALALAAQVPLLMRSFLALWKLQTTGETRVGKVK